MIIAVQIGNVVELTVVTTKHNCCMKHASSFQIRDPYNPTTSFFMLVQVLEMICQTDYIFLPKHIFAMTYAKTSHQ